MQKRPGRLHTSAETTEIVMPGDTNHMGTCFGGKIMQWIDICAAIAAQRFVYCPALIDNPLQVVTASVDSIQFRAPAKLGNVVTLKAMVNRVWKTSMEVGIRVKTEDLTKGKNILACKAFLTFVAVNNNGQPQEIPFLIEHELPWPEDRYRRFSAAGDRRNLRLEMRNKYELHSRKH